MRLRLRSVGGVASPISKEHHGKAEPFRTSDGRAANCFSGALANLRKMLMEIVRFTRRMTWTKLVE
jgi:hypothetical protein